MNIFQTHHGLCFSYFRRFVQVSVMQYYLSSPRHVFLLFSGNYNFKSSVPRCRLCHFEWIKTAFRICKALSSTKFLFSSLQMGVDIKRFFFQISCASDNIPAEDVSLTLEILCHETKTKLNCFSHSELLGQERIWFWRFIMTAMKRKLSNPVRLLKRSIS